MAACVVFVLVALGLVRGELLSVLVGSDGGFSVAPRSNALGGHEFGDSEAAYGEFKNEMFTNGWFEHHFRVYSLTRAGLFLRSIPILPLMIEQQLR
jgi:hypothetical protein